MPTPKKGYWLDGVQVPSVTQIIGRFKDSGALLQWAFKQGREAGLAGKSTARLYDDTRAVDIGTHVHAMVEADLHGYPMPAWPEAFMDEMKTAADNAFRSYKQQVGIGQLFIMPLEVQLVSARYRFGGTPDAITEVDGQIDIGDWKTSNRIYPDHVIQLAAYRQLWNEAHPDQPASGGRIFRFGKETGLMSERPHYYDSATLDIAWKLFVAYREAWDLSQQLEERL